MRARLGRMWTMVDGRWVHARRTFATDACAPTVVLVHGLGMSSRYMLPLLDELGDRVNGFAVDLPGYGKSQNPRRRLGLSGLVEALAAWMATTHLPSATLIGNSLGAQLVAQFAARYPGRVERTVLIGMTCDPVSGGPTEHLGRLILDSLRERPGLAIVATHDYLRAGPRHMFGLLGEALRASVEEHLSQVRAPSLVVRGDRDPICGPQWNHRVAELIPNSIERVIAGAPHAVNFSAPQPLAEMVLQFCRANPAGR